MRSGTRAPSFLALSLAFGALAGACYSGPSVGEQPGPSATATPREAGAVNPTGLPCEVRDLLATECLSCHGSTPSRGAKTPLASLEDLKKDFEGKNVAVLSVERMKDRAAPMPPSGLLAAEPRAAFEKWVAEGMPAATCGGDAPKPEEKPIVCTSGKYWEGATTPQPKKPSDDGDDDDDDDDEWEETELMNPGRNCVQCHDEEDGPRLAFGGTVYPTLREPDECFGVNGLAVPLRVVVTDATGREHIAVVNETGNFVLESKRNPVAYPVRAKIVGANGERAMKDPVAHGDCNLCHAADKGEAPGRILGP